MIFLCARHTWCTELFFSEAPLCVRNVTLSLSQLLFVTSWSCCLLTRCVRVGGRLDVSSSRQAQRWSVVVLVLWCNWIARTVQCLALAKPSGPCIGAVQEALSRFPVPVFPSHDTPSAALPHHTGCVVSLLFQAASSQGSRPCTEDSWCASFSGREPAA